MFNKTEETQTSRVYTREKRSLASVNHFLPHRPTKLQPAAHNTLTTLLSLRWAFLACFLYFLAQQV